MKTTACLFLLFFGLYLMSLPPALAPYRDTGEMAVSAQTLGVSHPTSYPLYILLGHVAESLPLANRAYRLGLLSVLAAAAAVAALFAMGRTRWGLAPALGAAALLGFNGTFWSIAQVQEMYSLGMLAALALLALVFKLRERWTDRIWYGFVFVYGVVLTNRLDLLLWAPGLVWISLADRPGKVLGADSLWITLLMMGVPAAMFLLDGNLPIALLVPALVLRREPRLSPWLLLTLFFTVLGLSVYLYLPIRSAHGPWLDWNHPALLSNFLDSILRTRYGGTLDLISKNYFKGELFATNIIMYAQHIWNNFTWAGLLAAAVGGTVLARRDRFIFVGLLAAYLWSGPLFLLMANMPPNPHASAILDPHYLLSDIVLIVLILEGLAVIAVWAKPAAFFVALFLMLMPWADGRAARFNRREHFFSYDYARNVFLSAPRGASVAAKKDVQLYALWYYQSSQGWRPDLRVISQGLSGSQWYRADWRRRDSSFAFGHLIDAASWNAFAVSAQPAFATLDADLPSEIIGRTRPRGLLMALSADNADNASLHALMARRGRYVYEDQPDFFTSDLIDTYAQAEFRHGSDLTARGTAVQAREWLLIAWARHWLFREPATFLGYAEFTAGHLSQAAHYYDMAAILDAEVLKLAEKYHALPALTASLRANAAATLTQRGAIAEKIGDRLGAELFYMRALAIVPLAQTHFNLAVLYWGKNDDMSAQELEQALQLEPGRADATHYLQLLRTKLRK